MVKSAPTLMWTVGSALFQLISFHVFLRHRFKETCILHFTTVLVIITITDGNECRRTFCWPHWEVCTHHTQFKVALLAFDCVRGMGPTYFTCICVPMSDNTARSSLRSAQRGDLFVPRTRMKLGTRSIHVAAPTVWK